MGASLAIIRLLKKKPYLTWWIKNKEEISEESSVFSILNYGDFSDFRFLLKEMGILRVKEIFEKQIRQRNDYKKKTVHFFHLYFQKHASRNS